MNTEASELDELDVEVRTPSVVVSVRVDDATARALHGIAKRRGVRVSDVLRDAAVEYARGGWAEPEGGLVVTGGSPDMKFSFGNRGTSSEGQGGTTIKSDLGWGDRVQTGLATAAT